MLTTHRSMFRMNSSGLRAVATRAGGIRGARPYPNSSRGLLRVWANDDYTKPSGPARAHGVTVRRRTESRTTSEHISAGFVRFRDPYNGKFPARGEQQTVNAIAAAAGQPEPATAGSFFDAKLFSMIVLIAGTTIGGGTLSLPAAASAPGFFPSAAALLTCFMVLFLEGCLMVEVTVRMKAEGSAREGEPVSFEQMAERTLGKIGGNAIGLVYQFYSYASILAYVAAVGEIVSLLVKGALTSAQGQVATVFTIWAVILFLGKRGIESVNEKLNYVFLALMATIIIVGLGQVNPGVMAAHASWVKAPAAAGILLFNVVFHDIVPLVCQYLDYNVKKINTAFFLGGGIPLVAYLLWIAVALGSSAAAAGGAFVDPMMEIMRSGSAQGKVVQVWALLAIGTSFIGCGMAQAEYEASLMRQFMEPRWKNFTSEVGKKMKSLWENGLLDQLSYASVLLPPLAVSLMFLALGHGSLAYKAADLAGAYGVSILYGILPPVMAFILRRQQAEKKIATDVSTTPGGPVLLLVCFLFGMGVTVRETLSYFV